MRFVAMHCGLKKCGLKLRECFIALFPTKTFLYDCKCANSDVRTGGSQCSESVFVISKWRERNED